MSFHEITYKMKSLMSINIDFEEKKNTFSPNMKIFLLYKIYVSRLKYFLLKKKKMVALK